MQNPHAPVQRALDVIRELDDFEHGPPEHGPRAARTARGEAHRLRLEPAVRAAGVRRRRGVADGIVGAVGVGPFGGPGGGPRVAGEVAGAVDVGLDGLREVLGAGRGGEVASLDGLAVDGEVEIVGVGGGRRAAGWGERSHGRGEGAGVVGFVVSDLAAQGKHSQAALQGRQETEQLLPVFRRVVLEGNSKLHSVHADDQSLAT